MQHLDHDRLVFLALGESEPDDGERAYLEGCEHCRSELENLRRVADLGAEGQGLHDLPGPPDHLWQGIVAEIRAAEQLPTLVEPRRPVTAPETSDDPPARVLSPSVRKRVRWSGWMTTVATAAAAAVLGVVGTVAVLGGTEPEPASPQQQTVRASASLAAFGATPPEVNGEARVFDNGRLHLHVVNLPDVSGYYEVWLIDPGTMEMFSVGVLGGDTDALLPLPPNADLERYSVVDISAERYDNNTAHSGDSLVRGTLTG
ncbi:anti-sigma factor [Salinispora oceanensis]|uniref:anti-sigma factor n=1 Tax=Salinispora oceanensis TaxID=1050199 RepID=UPI000370145B|nr:anti-sigma factor [Salinispora oceanensis]